VQGAFDRPKLKSGSGRLGATAEEYAAIAGPFGANFGNWSVNEIDKTFIWRYEIALIPNNDGAEFTTSISLAGDEMTLVENAAVGGRPAPGSLVRVYKRAK
jgi:hypothetical protein